MGGANEAAASIEGYSDDRFFIVVPDSIRPLTITVDSTGNKVTGYACLDSLNRANAVVDIYHSFVNPSHSDDGIYSVCVGGIATIDLVIAAYAMSSCLDSAFGMRTVDMFAVPDDPLYDTGVSASPQWALDWEHTRVDQAWEITTGREDVVVAVTDWGFCWDHPDLARSVFVNPEEDSNGNGTFEPWPSDSAVSMVFGDLDDDDDDGNGYKDDVVGLLFGSGWYRSDTRVFGVGSVPDQTPDHGTIVASIIAATTNNGVGMAGVAGGWDEVPGVRLIAAAVQSGGGTADVWLNAVEYAVNSGADIINMSWGFPPSEMTMLEAKRLDSLLATAYYDSNMMCIAASGNSSGQDIRIPAAFGEFELWPAYPEYLTNEGRVQGVGSTGINDSKCASSTYGNAWYDLGAPGFNWGAVPIGDSLENLTYGYRWTPDNTCATSLAAPCVAGIAALVWSAHRNESDSEIVARLTANANHDINTGYFRHGNIDAFAAIIDQPPSPWHDTVRIYGDAVIAQGDSVVIDSGTVVIIGPQDFGKSGSDTNSIEIIVNGILRVRGADTLPAIFRSDEGGALYWQGIRVNSGGQAYLDNVMIRHAYGGIEYLSGSSGFVEGCVFESCQVFGVYAEAPNIFIHRSIFRDIPGYGIHAPGDGVWAVRDSFYNCDYGIYRTGLPLEGTDLIDSCQFGRWNDNSMIAGIYTKVGVTIRQCGFKGGFQDAAVKVGSGGISTPLIYSCGFEGNGIGGRALLLDALSRPTVRCSDFTNYRDLDVYSYKSIANLGRDTDTNTWGRNRFMKPLDHDTIIQAVTNTVYSEWNYYFMPSPQDSNFLGPVDWAPYFLTDLHMYGWESGCGYCGGPIQDTGGIPQTKAVVYDPLPKGFTLLQNYPNPFNTGTIIQYWLPQAARVEVGIFNVMGQRVRVLVDHVQAGGMHRAEWDGKDNNGKLVASGVYLYRVVAGADTVSRKMVLLR